MWKWADIKSRGDFNPDSITPKEKRFLQEYEEKHLTKEKIEEIFTKGGFYDIPDRLVDAANAGGGPDNITALLLGVEPLEVKHG